jgi:hypothetical protein
LDINGIAFRELVQAIVQRILAEQGRMKRRLYVICEPSFDVLSVSSWYTPSGTDEVVCIVPDDWPAARKDAVSRSCPGCRIVSRTASADLPLEGSLTVYPACSSSFVAKAALGIADTFETQWFQQCLRAGSQVRLLLSGLAKFSGKEPPAYVQRILSYYRILLTYDVKIGPWEELAPAPCQGGNRTETGRIITVSDISTYTDGSVITIAPQTIVTDYAKEEADKRHIRFIRTDY